jgi:hypothetical protein
MNPVPDEEFSVGSEGCKSSEEEEIPSPCEDFMCDVKTVLECSVIRSECVTQLLINPIIRTRTRLISGEYLQTRHNILKPIKPLVVYCALIGNTSIK